MTAEFRDRIISSILLVFALGWCAVVWATIPPGGAGTGIGPRAVPFWLGVLLAVLSLALLAGTFSGSRKHPDTDENGVPMSRERRHSEIWALGWIVGSTVVYTMLMDWFGYVPATFVVVLVLLRVGLGVRSLPVLLGMSVGLSFGIYLVMGVLMGVYLPRGTLLTLF